jgi:hypothetical protein
MHGGACEQLGVSVHSDWAACQLALPAFASNWNNVEELATANWPELPQVIHSQELANVSRMELETSSVGINN